MSCDKENVPEEIPLPTILSVSVVEKGICDFEFIVKLSDNGAANKVGILYSSDPAVPDNSSRVLATETAKEEYTILLTGLKETATYYAKAFVSDDKIINLSDIKQLKTSSLAYTNSTLAAEKFAGGTGSQSDPYLIASAEHLKLLQQEVSQSTASSKAFFRLTTDIEVTADEWTPIGNPAESEAMIDSDDPQIAAQSFKGTFDGGGHTISGTLKSDKSLYFGFFGYLGEGASVSNLTIAATVRNEIFSETKHYIYTGAIAGFSKAPISNCKATGSIYGGYCMRFLSSTGGIAGYADANITDCEVIANVSEDGSSVSFTGGIVGGTISGSITNCKYSGKLTGGSGHSSSTGGIAGHSHVYNSLGSIKNCSVQATIVVATTANGRSLESFTGGIIGSANFTIIDCTVSGSITGGLGYSFTGGIAGKATINDDGKFSNIINCVNSATVTGGPNSEWIASNGGNLISEPSLAGGIAGFNLGNITNCKSLGKVTGKGSYTGGIAGLCSTMEWGRIHISTISNCSVEAPVEGENFDVSSTSTSAYTGGIAGTNYGIIRDCNVAASATISGYYANGNVGGIVGQLAHDQKLEDFTGALYDCTNNADVSGKGNVGGIVGTNAGLVHTNSNTGNVSGLTELSYVGGLAGENQSWEGAKSVIYSCSTNSGLVNAQPASDSNRIGQGKAVVPCPEAH